MQLSEFLKMNGGLELKKKCRIPQPMWDDLLNNVRPPSITTCENIIQCLGGKSLHKQRIYRDALWKCILYNARPISLFEMIVHISPCAAPRPRFSRFGHPYNPKKYTQWKRKFSDLVGDIGVISGPCSISVEYYFKTSIGGDLGYHSKLKDIDNLDKSTLDALQLNGLIEDDKNVYEMNSIKFFGFEDKIKIKIRHNGFWAK